MERTLTSYLAVGFLLTISQSALAETPPAPTAENEAKILVRIYNYAQVKPSTLMRAEQAATNVLHHAGIRVAWIDCQLLAEENPPECNRPVEAAEFVLRILRRSMALGTSGFQDAFGYAYPLQGGGGAYLTVLYDRVEQETNKRYLHGLILGHVIAHEIGHLLLGFGHSPIGIMQAELREQQWQDAAQGNLCFTPQQGELLRVAVNARMGQAQYEPVSKLTRDH